MLVVVTYLLVTIEVLCSLLLIGVILLQRTKAQGAGLAFGANVGESMFGSQVGNVLTRTTVVIFTSDNGPHSEGGHSVTRFNSAGGFQGY